MQKAQRIYQFSCLRGMYAKIHQNYFPPNWNHHQELTEDEFLLVFDMRKHVEDEFKELIIDYGWEYSPAGSLSPTEVLMFGSPINVQTKAYGNVHTHYDYQELLCIYRDVAVSEYRKGRICGHVSGAKAIALPKWQYLQNHPNYNFEDKVMKEKEKFEQRFPDPNHPDNPYLRYWLWRESTKSEEKSPESMPKIPHYLFD